MLLLLLLLVHHTIQSDWHFKMSVLLKRFLKLTCAAVSLSWIGCQGLLLYQLKFGESKVPIETMSLEAIPLTTRESREGLVDAVRRLYSLDYSKERMNFFVENATFEDPAVFLCGKAAIASGFSKMESLFKVSEGLKSDIIHGDKVIAIDQVQRYTLPGDISFELPSVIYLYLEGEPGNEKIVRQVEEWYSKPIIGREAPYFANLGSLASQFRKIHGLPFKYV